MNLKSFFTGKDDSDEKLNTLIAERDKSLKELAGRKAKHFALQNRPALTGDHLLPYTGEIRSGYESLLLQVLQTLLPDVHFPEAKMETEHAGEKDKKLSEEIRKLQKQNESDAYELEGYNPKEMLSRLGWAFFCTGMLFIGEVVYNTTAFELFGDSRLFALILSISLSFGVVLFSHAVPMLYKHIRSRFWKRVVLWGTLFLMTAVFTGLSVFRTALLAERGVHVNPVWFVVINLFFFITSSLLSYFLLPDWNEIKGSWGKVKKHLTLRKREQEVKRLEKEREENKFQALLNAKAHLRAPYQAKYVRERIKKLSRETIELFKSVNLLYRPDGKTPDCFHEEPQDIDEGARVIDSPNDRGPQ